MNDWGKTRRVREHEVYDVKPSLVKVSSKRIVLNDRSWSKQDTRFGEGEEVEVHIPVGALSGLNKFAITRNGDHIEVWSRD